MLFRLFYITWDYDIDWEKLRPDFKSNVFRLCRENSRPSLSINFIMISKVLLEKFLIYCDRKSSILYCTSHSIISRISFIQDDEQYRKNIIGLLLRAKRQFYFSLEISTFKDICILLTDLLYSNFSMILLNTLFDVKMNDHSVYIVCLFLCVRIHNSHVVAEALKSQVIINNFGGWIIRTLCQCGSFPLLYGV